MTSKEGAVGLVADPEKQETDVNNADVTDGEVNGVEKDGTPPTPKTPGVGMKTPNKQTPQRKTSREVDSGRKAWVRRKSKPSITEATPRSRKLACLRSA